MTVHLQHSAGSVLSSGRYTHLANILTVYKGRSVLLSSLSLSLLLSLQFHTTHLITNYCRRSGPAILPFRALLTPNYLLPGGGLANSSGAILRFSLGRPPPPHPVLQHSREHTHDYCILIGCLLSRAARGLAEPAAGQVGPRQLIGRCGPRGLEGR